VLVDLLRRWCPWLVRGFMAWGVREASRRGLVRAQP
jgi:hypothetical protein